MLVGCPKCRGQMFVEGDQAYKFHELVCLQCGYRKPIAVKSIALPRVPQLTQPFTVSDYVAKRKYLEKLGARSVPVA